MAFLTRFSEGKNWLLDWRMRAGWRAGWRAEQACPGHNYVVHCQILKSFGTFVHHHQTVCRAKELRQYLQGQGHNLSLKVKNGHK